MTDQATKARDFTALHISGDPIIIYNAWDGGSARAIADSGAKAVATGDHPVGFSHGFTDDNFEDFTFDIYQVSIADIARAVSELPLSVDISNGWDLDDKDLAERIKTLLDMGVVGINFEDRLSDDSGLASAESHAARIKVIRDTAEAAGIPLFINARSDLFMQADASEHTSLIDAAVQRAELYRTAGASGFFAPGLMDIELIKQLCEQCSLPVNIIRLPGAPSTADLRAAGVSRISYGPVVQMQMIKWLKEQAAAAFSE